MGNNMGTKKSKCVICGGTIKYDESSAQYKCLKCNASYDENLLTPAKKKPKPKHAKIKINLCMIIMALLMVLYLLWFLYRPFQP